MSPLRRIGTYELMVATTFRKRYPNISGVWFQDVQVPAGAYPLLGSFAGPVLSQAVVTGLRGTITAEYLGRTYGGVPIDTDLGSQAGTSHPTQRDGRDRTGAATDSGRRGREVGGGTTDGIGAAPVPGRAGKNGVVTQHILDRSALAASVAAGGFLSRTARAAFSQDAGLIPTRSQRLTSIWIDHPDQRCVNCGGAILPDLTEHLTSIGDGLPRPWQDAVHRRSATSWVHDERLAAATTSVGSNGPCHHPTPSPSPSPSPSLATTIAAPPPAPTAGPPRPDTAPTTTAHRGGWLPVVETAYELQLEQARDDTAKTTFVVEAEADATMPKGTILWSGGPYADLREALRVAIQRGGDATAASPVRLRRVGHRAVEPVAADLVSIDILAAYGSQLLSSLAAPLPPLPPSLGRGAMDLTPTVSVATRITAALALGAPDPASTEPAIERDLPWDR